MTDQIESRYSLTKPAILAHPNLFTPRAFGKKGKESGTPKYSANLVLDKDHLDLTALKALAAQVAKARWPGRDLKELKFPFASGDAQADKRKAKSGRDDGEYQRGKVVLAARSQFEPRLAGIENGKITDYEGDARLKAKNKFYFGVLVLATVNFVAYEGVGANPDGVTAYLDMVFTTNKGQKIGNSGMSAAEAFKGYVGHATDEDPTGGAELEDEIPF